MSYRLIIKPSAEKDLGRPPRPLQRRILDRLLRIEVDPRASGAVQLTGSKATYRVRVGAW